MKYNLENVKIFSKKCIETNEDLLKFGGSSELRICLTVSQLNSFFNEDDENVDSLIWSDEQKQLLAKYSNGLIQSCKALADNSHKLNDFTLENAVRYPFKKFRIIILGQFGKFCCVLIIKVCLYNAVNFFRY